MYNVYNESMAYIIIVVNPSVGYLQKFNLNFAEF